MPDSDQTEQLPGVTITVAAMRSVLRTSHDSPGDGPEALEERVPGDGWSWRWTTDAGAWRVTVGGAPNPRPVVHGPAGVWQVDGNTGEHAAGVVLVLLRAAGALPPAAPADPASRYMPCCYADLGEARARGRDLVCGTCGAPFMPPLPSDLNQRGEARMVEDHRLDEERPRFFEPRPGAAHPRTVTLSPVTAVVHGERHAVPPITTEPLRAVIYRASDPAPEVPPGFVAVQATSDEPDEHGWWRVRLPDGRFFTYEPDAPHHLIPYGDPASEPEPLSGARRTLLLAFAPGQRPGVRTMMMLPDGGTVTWSSQTQHNGLPAPGAATYTRPARQPAAQGAA